MCGHTGASSEPTLDLLTRVLERGISLQEPQALSHQGSPLLLQRREAEVSRVSELPADTTPWGPCDHSGLQPGPACLSRCAQPIHSHPEGSRMGSDGGGPEMSPEGALKLPIPRWRSAQGIPEDGTPGCLILGRRPWPPLPRGHLLDPGCSRCLGCSRRSPGAQRPPSSFKGDAA